MTRQVCGDMPIRKNAKRKFGGNYVQIRKYNKRKK